jgi:hypothetical protein
MRFLLAAAVALPLLAGPSFAETVAAPVPGALSATVTLQVPVKNLSPDAVAAGHKELYEKAAAYCPGLTKEGMQCTLTSVDIDGVISMPNETRLQARLRVSVTPPKGSGASSGSGG